MVPRDSFVGNMGEKWLFHFADEKRLKASFSVPHAITNELEPEARSPQPFSISPGNPVSNKSIQLCLPCLPLLSPVSGNSASLTSSPYILCFPGGSDRKESACSAEDPGLIPGSGRSPGKGHGSPLQYSCQWLTQTPPPCPPFLVPQWLTRALNLSLKSFSSMGRAKN